MGARPGTRRKLWYSDVARRTVFEAPLRHVNRTLWSRGPVNFGRYQLVVQLTLVDGTLRHVRIVFDDDHPETPKVFVIGDERRRRWPHRYHDGSLCMWFPRDPPDQRWLLQDGLMSLIGYIEAHLFREVWWLENDEWLGPEAGHTPLTPTRRSRAA